MMNVYRLINPRCRFASLQTPSLYAYHNKTEGLKAPGYLNPRLSDVFRSTFNVHRFDKRLCRRHLYMLHNKTEGLKAPGYSNPRLSGVFRSTFNVHRFDKRLCRRHLYMLHNKTEGLKAPGYSNPRLSDVFRSSFNVQRSSFIVLISVFTDAIIKSSGPSTWGVQFDHQFPPLFTTGCAGSSPQSTTSRLLTMDAFFSSESCTT